MLVGPSGGGKTTALKLINRLIPFDEGDIRIDGRTIRDLPVVELRRGIGYVIQQVGLFPHMTIGENIAHRAAAARLAEGQDRAPRTPSCSSWSGSSRATPSATRPQLSGGQRQRVGLARALAADPPVLLMDEPFGALDPITRARLQDEVRRLHREVAKTIIFVTHDIDEAIKMGDRIAILREGGVLAQYDTPDEILAHPADEFVAQFIGEDRALRRLALRRLGDVELEPVPANRPALEASSSTTVRNASRCCSEAAPTGSSSSTTTGRASGMLTLARAAELLAMIAAGGPVIPNFGSGSSCVTGDNPFCWGWVKEHWGDTLRPALVQHIELTASRSRSAPCSRSGSRSSPTAAGATEQPISIVVGADLHVPEHRALPAARPVHRTHRHDDRDRARRLHARDPLPELRRRARRRAARRARGGARDGADAAARSSARVELPLALPAMIGGLRIAVVSTIAIATIAAIDLREGARPSDLLRDRSSRRRSRPRSTRPGVLAVALALALRRRARPDRPRRRPRGRGRRRDDPATPPTRTRSSMRSASSPTTRTSR